MVDSPEHVKRLEKKNVRPTAIRLLVVDAILSAKRAVSLSDLEIIPQKKGKTKVQFTTKNEEDVYTYTITLWENGSANIYVQPMRRQSISYLGRLEQ